VIRTVLVACCSLPLLAACSTATVNMAEPRRVVGTESSVRVDGEITASQGGGPIGLVYVITNDRSTPIAVADIVPETSWDGETRTATVSIGSEVPGATILPRLILIGPGEKKSFTASARLARAIAGRSADPALSASAFLRLKVNFLGRTEPFAELIDIPEKGIADSKRADELFGPWVESNEAVFTNAVPVEVSQSPGVRSDGPQAPPARRSRGRS
jgi:hypothetical protein